MLTLQLRPRRVLTHILSHTLQRPNPIAASITIPPLHDEGYVCGCWMELSNGDAWIDAWRYYILQSMGIDTTNSLHTWQQRLFSR